VALVPVASPVVPVARVVLVAPLVPVARVEVSGTGAAAVVVSGARAAREQCQSRRSIQPDPRFSGSPIRK
jgi:hypothetical protein